MTPVPDCSGSRKLRKGAGACESHSCGRNADRIQLSRTATTDEWHYKTDQEQCAQANTIEHRWSPRVPSPLAQTVPVIQLSSICFAFWYVGMPQKHIVAECACQCNVNYVVKLAHPCHYQQIASNQLVLHEPSGYHPLHDSGSAIPHKCYAPGKVGTFQGFSRAALQLLQLTTLEIQVWTIVTTKEHRLMAGYHDLQSFR